VNEETTRILQRVVGHRLDPAFLSTFGVFHSFSDKLTSIEKIEQEWLIMVKIIFVK
jgi:hypothetical protein